MARAEKEKDVMEKEDTITLKEQLTVLQKSTPDVL